MAKEGVERGENEFQRTALWIMLRGDVRVKACRSVYGFYLCVEYDKNKLNDETCVHKGFFVITHIYMFL